MGTPRVLSTVRKSFSHLEGKQIEVLSTTRGLPEPVGSRLTIVGVFGAKSMVVQNDSGAKYTINIQSASFRVVE